MKKRREIKRICSQKAWSEQTHAMVGKSAQPEKMINRDRTKNPTQLDPATNCSAEKQGVLEKSKYLF